jgi:DNA-binding NtrC family response regulator
MYPDQAVVFNHRARGTAGALSRHVKDRATNPSILLVDDNLELLKALAKVLEKDGYLVVPQSSATDALKHVNATKQLFDLVITDVSMPGMNGLGLLAAYKTAFPQTPVIVITAFGDWGQYMEALRGGAFEYLNKPLDKNDLLATVKRALGNGKPQQVSRPQ